MDKREIVAGIEKLGPWFQKIELPGGQTTKRKSMFGEPIHHPHKIWRRLFLYLTSAADPVFGKEYPRQHLENAVAPGDAVSWCVTLNAPQEPGLYDIEVDLVAEHVSLFQDVGSTAISIRLEVAP